MQTTPNINLLAFEPKDHSSGLLIPENVGTKVMARNLLRGDKLERGPPLSLKENFVVEPIRDRLLRHRRASEVFAELLREKGLAAGEFDSALERRDISFLHERRDYTSAFVFANNSTRMTPNKEACTVVLMPQRKKKRVAIVVEEPAQARAPIGPDGKTVGQRLAEAMRAMRGPDYRETDLFLEVNERVGASADNPLISQQMINAVRNDKIDNTRSFIVGSLAEVLGIRPIWLQWGAGSMRAKDDLADELRDLIRKRTGS